jgi:hypothetical protein
MSESRLTALPSYRALTGSQQSLVRLVLIDGLKPLRACAVLGLANPTRTWNTAKVQAVVTAYGNPELETDWERRLAAIREDDTPNLTAQDAPESRQDGFRATAETIRVPEPAPKPTPEPPAPPPTAKPPDPDRCPTCRLVLCHCPRPVVLGGTSTVDPADLFPNVNAEIMKGVTVKDLWRRQAADEREYRESLIRELLGRSEPSF